MTEKGSTITPIFYPSTRHNGDFLVFAGSPDPALHSSMLALGAGAVTIRSNLTLFSFGLPEGTRSVPDGYAALYGAARIGDTLRIGPRIIEAPADSDVTGQCFLIENRANSVTLRSDFMGLFPAFYTKTSRGFICSNRIHLIALAMRALSIPVRLDHASAASLLCNSFGLGGQLGIWRTPLADVFLLGINERREDRH